MQSKCFNIIDKTPNNEDVDYVYDELSTFTMKHMDPSYINKSLVPRAIRWYLIQKRLKHLITIHCPNQVMKAVVLAVF